MVLFGAKQKVCQEVCPLNMKTTTSGFSQLTVSLSIVSVFLMLTGSSMAAPVQTSIGQAAGLPSMSTIYSYIYAKSLRLSKIVGETQADFAKDRLGDANYDEYIPRIPGLPLPSWHLDQMTEHALLKKTVEELYLFKGFIEGMKAHESQDKSSQFTAKFKEIQDEIDSLINLIQNVQMILNYPATHPTGLPQPTFKPAATQKELDELELGVLKQLLWWLVPVQAEFYRETKA